MPRPRPNSPSPASWRPIDLNCVRAIVARTRAEQGLTATITDPVVIARLATMVAGQLAVAAP